MCMDDALLISCRACENEFCTRCITHLLGDGGVEEVLSDPEWGCFKCDVNLTTYRRADMERFFSTAAKNGHDMQCDHTVEKACSRLDRREEPGR